MKENKIFITFFLLVIFNFNHSAFGEDAYSARREVGVSYKSYADKYMSKGRTVINSAMLYRGASSVARSPEWASYNDLYNEFIRIRDTRFLKRTTNFPRRIFWLYPNDGCYVRAALVNRLSYLANKKPPGKVFAFGNLRFKTKNSPRGVVRWWYHVAPIVQVANKKYVLDPAIEPLRPITLYEWLRKIGHPSKIKVAVCSTGAYVPNSMCAKFSRGESYAIKHANKYLIKEWNRVIALRKNPYKELGGQPPWISFTKKSALFDLLEVKRLEEKRF